MSDDTPDRILGHMERSMDYAERAINFLIRVQARYVLPATVICTVAAFLILAALLIAQSA